MAQSGASMARKQGRSAGMAAGSGRLLLLQLLLAAAACAALLQGAAAECVVRLDVLPTTNLTFSGTSSASVMPGSFQVSVAGSSAGEDGASTPPPAISLSGAMYLRLAGANTECPTTAGEWAAAAAAGGLQLTSGPSGYHYKPLALAPPTLPLSVMGVPLNMSALELNVTIRSSSSDKSSSKQQASVNATIVHGYVYSNTPLTGGPQLQAMGDATSLSTARLELNVSTPAGQAGAGGSAQQLSVALPDFKATFVGKTYGVAGGKPWSGSLTFSLSGPLLLSGLVGCPVDCGSFGRCVAAAANSSSSSKQYACECECGWGQDPSTGRCDVPAGTCPLFPSSFSATPLLLAGGRGGNTSSSSCAGGADAVAATGGSCPAKYGYDVATKACKRCETEGWGGAGCRQCATDDACKAKLDKPQAICTTSMLYNERSQAKAYSCSLTDPTLAKIVGPVLPLTCSTGGGSSSAKGPTGSAVAVSDSSLVGSTATCSLSFRMMGMPAGSSATCVATGCAFVAGSPSFECSGVVCDCTGGCPAAYTKTFKDVHGTVTIDCDTTGAACTIVVGSLNMKIKASCEASECLDPAGPKLVSSEAARTAGPPLGPPLVAALPLLALVCAGLVCAAALARYRPFLRSSSKHAADAAAAAAAAGDNGKGGGAASRLSGASPRAAASSAAGPVAEAIEHAPAQGSAAAAAAAAAAAPAAGQGAVAPPSPARTSGSTSPDMIGTAPAAAGAAGAGADGANGAVAAHLLSYGGVPLTPLLSPRSGGGGAHHAALRGSTSNTTSGSGSAASSAQIQELSFYDVTADVKMPRSWKELAACLTCRSSTSTSTSAAHAAAPAPAAVLGKNGGGGKKGDLEQGVLSIKAAAAQGGADESDVAPLSEQAAGAAASPNKAGGAVGASAQQQQQQQQQEPGGRWRRVLQGVSGCVGSGEVLGIMGPSGGGKSTLLMKLCGGLGGGGRGGEWRSGGVVALDGVAAPPSLLTAVTALVPQDDSLMRSLTVEECVRYSAALRLDPALSPAAVNARVNAVLDSLGLAKIRRSTVLSGTGVSGVSGGERRRVAIAMELVIDPQVLVLDEPLSGLDSYTALQLMRSLQAVADSGRVVALSLHQPSPALFGALDNAMLLAGGVLVYSGPPHAAASALAGLGCPVPSGITVAEHLLHVVSDPASLRHVIAAAADQQRRQSEARRQSGAAVLALQDQAQLAAGGNGGNSCYPPIKTSLVSREPTEPGGWAVQQQQHSGDADADKSAFAHELSMHALRQQCPPHMQSAAAAAAASLADGSKGGAAAQHSQQPLSPKMSWWQRVMGMHQGGSSGGQDALFYSNSRQLYGHSTQQQQQQPLSPKPSWYQRISAAPRPPKGAGPAAAAAAAGGAGAAAAGVRLVGGGSSVGAPSVGGHSSSKAARLALGLPKQRRPFVRQVGVLFWRGLLDMLRNPLLTAFHALGGLVLGLLVGIIFFGVKSDTSGAQNRVGAIFFALCLLAFTSVTSVDLVQAESAAAGREMQRRYYSPAAYALTKLVLDGLLLRALPALLFGLPFYFLMGLNAAAVQVVVFLLVLIAFSATVGALALGFASALDSPGKTILVMNLVLLLGVLFGGFLANKGSIPVWLRWVSWLSVFRYAWEALVINELSNLDLFLSAPGVALSLPVKGQIFLQVIGVDSSLFMADIAVLVAMYGASCIFVAAVLAWRHRVRNE